MTIEKNAYLTTLNNKVVYDKTFKTIESNFKYARFFDNGEIQVNGRAVEFLLNWANEGIDWANDLSPYNSSSGFLRKVNVVPFRLTKILDKVYYVIINPERFEEALSSEGAVKDFTKKLLEQASDKPIIDLETKVPELICNDDNFVKYNDTTKTGNLYEEGEDFWKDPIKILKALFDGDDLLSKASDSFNKGYPEDPDDKGSTYKKLATNSRKRVLILNNSTSNTITIGGYKENVNFNALDLEKRFGSENIIRDNLPNNYEMILTDERSIQLFKKAQKEGFRNMEEASNGNQWFFINPIVHGGFITAFNSLAWKRKTS